MFLNYILKKQSLVTLLADVLVLDVTDTDLLILL